MTTTDLPEWLLELRDTVAAISNRFLSIDEFRRIVADLLKLESSPLDAISFHFAVPDNLSTFDVDVGDLESSREKLNTVNRQLSGESRCECRISTLLKANAPWFADHPGETLDELRLLADAFWKGGLRDDKSRLPALQGSHSIDLFEATIRNALDVNGSAACLFCDLDKFKQVNDLISMAKGDDVLRRVAGVLHDVANPIAIALHRSGDEYVVILPACDQNDALNIGMEIVGRVREHDFDTGAVQVRMSSGIAYVTSDQPALTYPEFEQLAEKAVKLSGGAKIRDAATLRSSIERTSFTPISSDAINRAICLVKGNPGDPSPFESPILNVLSRRATAIAGRRSFEWTTVAYDLNDLIAHLNVTNDPAILRSSEKGLEGWDARPVASPLDLCLATANGLLIAGLLAGKEHVEGKKLVVHCDGEAEKSARLALEPGDHTLLVVPYASVQFDEIDLGGFHYFNIADDIDPHAAQRALLIKIGHAALGIPDSLFAAVLVVDDRPTRGGELRDFWESVIARLVATVSSNPNIEKIYVLGNQAYARETVRRLQSLDSWPAESEYLSYKTGATASDLTAVGERLRGKIEFVENESELYGRFANDLRNEAFLPPLRPVKHISADQRFLRRQLELGNVALTRHDGCRVPTIARAFPIVVEIARTAEENELIRDQAGQLLYELVDFKVHLTSPLQDRIPAFYQGEKESLDEYLRRAFINDDALFGSKIRDGDQLNSVLNHVAAAIRDPRKQFATRRGILVLPNIVGASTELSPLGLVSIRIIPRFSKHKTTLHYSFTWRTVEALVGFPYSIFGSVGFAEHLTGLIRGLVGGSASRDVDTGEVSYLAHSLHIFRDDYGQRIARRIVDDASL